MAYAIEFGGTSLVLVVAPMVVLVTGLILFFAPHTLRELGLRDGALGRLPSEAAYKGAFSLVSLLGLGLMIWGKSLAPFIMVWEPVFELRWISHYAMMPVFCLIMAGVGQKSLTRMVTRHPMLMGVFLWAAAHLWTNGDLASMLLFGSFALWSAVKIFSLWEPPDLGQFRKPMLVRDFLYLVTGSLLYFAVFVFHGDLFGVGLVLE